MPILEVVERLHSKMIARDEQSRSCRTKITDCESEHTIQSLHAIGAFLLVQVKNHFRVGVRSEAMPLTLEFAAELSEVVDFSVVRDPNCTVLIAHRHVPVGGKIENREAAAAQAHVGAVGKCPIPETRIVRTAMRLDRCHPRQRFPISTIHYTAN